MRTPRTHEPLRVLGVGTVYPPHLLGGYEVIWRGVTERLRADGVQARILVTGYRRPEVPAGAPEDPDVHRELDWYWRDHEWARFSLRERRAVERHNAAVFDRHLAEFRPHVVTWWPVGGLSLGLIERARRAGIPSVFFLLDPWPVYGPERDAWTRMWSGALRAPAARLAERVTGLPTRPRLPEAGRWVHCSAAMRQTLLDAGIVTPDETILAPGVGSRFADAPREPAAPQWRWRLLYIGRVVPQKGVLTAVQALAELPPQATLRIVGEGDDAYRRDLEATAERLGVRERVRFEPPRTHDQVLDVYRDADLVVFPVLWAEPWGLVPLEAMALGRPVVATGRGGSAEFLRDGENALLFDGSASGLAAAVRAVGEDAQLRERLRAGGYATAQAHREETFDERAAEEIRRVAARGRSGVADAPGGAQTPVG
jgi:glycosyltransferase involved in cell wall biosynthesis